MKWKEEAKQALSRVPFFVRGRVRKRVEEEASSRGAREVTLEHVDTCRQRFLNRMEEEVRGHRLETCFGQSGCPNRVVPSDEMSKALEKLLSGRNLKAFLKERVSGPLKMHHEFRVCLADCPNACSRPQIADVGIIGACVPTLSDEPCTLCGTCVDTCQESAVSLQGGTPAIDFARCIFCGQCIRACPTGTLKSWQVGYRILIGGKLGRHPRLGEELPGVHNQTLALEIVGRCLDAYQASCVKGERFGEIVAQLGPSEKERLIPAEGSG
jgi:dissimilatory sulfite reductase (desulfoviridin) alpha/beta subunit